MFGQMFQNLPEITKNLLIINIIVFVATFLFQAQGIDLNDTIGLYYFRSELFKPFQILTHMFAHGSGFHIFFNMFALFMFGGLLEKIWGGKKFLLFYLFTGFGAVILHMGVQHIEIESLINSSSYLGHDELIQYVNQRALEFKNLKEVQYHGGIEVEHLIYKFITVTVGASGAISGILAAFWILFPNTELMIMFIPVPVKAKYLIPLYFIYELFMGVQNFQGDNIAHFAHLGGALFGLILVLYWKKDRTNFY